MRIRKWRAWHSEKKKYYYFDFESMSYGDYEGLLIDTWDDVNLSDPHLIFEDFIGLQDKNKKDVYEGDLVRNGKDEAKVTFEAPEYVALFGESSENCCNLLFGDFFEVVGNVHEKF